MDQAGEFQSHVQEHASNSEESLIDLELEDDDPISALSENSSHSQNKTSQPKGNKASNSNQPSGAGASQVQYGQHNYVAGAGGLNNDSQQVSDPSKGREPVQGKVHDLHNVKSSQTHVSQQDANTQQQKQGEASNLPNRGAGVTSQSKTNYSFKDLQFVPYTHCPVTTAQQEIIDLVGIVNNTNNVRDVIKEQSQLKQDQTKDDNETIPLKLQDDVNNVTSCNTTVSNHSKIIITTTAAITTGISAYGTPILSANNVTTVSSTINYRLAGTQSVPTTNVTYVDLYNNPIVHEVASSINNVNPQLLPPLSSNLNQTRFNNPTFSSANRPTLFLSNMQSQISSNEAQLSKAGGAAFSQAQISSHSSAIPGTKTPIDLLHRQMIQHESNLNDIHRQAANNLSTQEEQLKAQRRYLMNNENVLTRAGEQITQQDKLIDHTITAITDLTVTDHHNIEKYQRMLNSQSQCQIDHQNSLFAQSTTLLNQQRLNQEDMQREQQETQRRWYHEQRVIMEAQRVMQEEQLQHQNRMFVQQQQQILKQQQQQQIPQQPVRQNTWTNRDIKPPTFSGIFDDKSPQEFIESLKLYCNSTNITEHEIITQLLPTILSEEANMWFTTRTNINCYVDFETEFFKFYNSPAYITQLTEQFNRRSQHYNEPLTHYCYIIKIFYKKLNITATEHQIIERIISKVCPQYNQYLCDKVFNTVSELETYALAIQNTIARKMLYVPPPSAKECIEPKLAWQQSTDGDSDSSSQSVKYKTKYFMNNNYASSDSRRSRYDSRNPEFNKSPSFQRRPRYDDRQERDGSRDRQNFYRRDDQYNRGRDNSKQRQEYPRGGYSNRNPRDNSREHARFYDQDRKKSPSPSRREDNPRRTQQEQRRTEAPQVRFEDTRRQPSRSPSPHPQRGPKNY